MRRIGLAGLLAMAGLGFAASSAMAGSRSARSRSTATRLTTRAGEPTDWDAPASAQNPPLTVTPFTDSTGRSDDNFGMGSKQQEPGGWACITGSSPAKGDIILAFDAENGGKTILVRAFEWTGSSTIGSFVPLATGTQGVTWDGATNGDGSNRTGNFGEAVLNLTDTIGEVSCGEFSSVFMKSRSSVEINSARTARSSCRARAAAPSAARP